jgi:hypothetical protein
VPKNPLFTSIFGVEFQELWETIRSAVSDILVSASSLIFSWFQISILLVKNQVLSPFFEPYARGSILTGGPYGACENDPFSQVGHGPSARISHCVKKTTCEQRKIQNFLKCLAKCKIFIMNKITHYVCVLFLCRLLVTIMVLEWRE